MERNKTIDERAAARIAPIWQRFLDTGDLDTLYNCLYFLSLDLEDARRHLRQFDSLLVQADKLRVRNYRLVEKLKVVIENTKSTAYEVRKVKEKSKSKSRQVR